MDFVSILCLFACVSQFAYGGVISRENQRFGGTRKEILERRLYGRATGSALTCSHKGVPKISPKAPKLSKDDNRVKSLKPQLTGSRRRAGSSEVATLSKLENPVKSLKKRTKNSRSRAVLQRRSRKDHPSATSAITLYHGTTIDAAKAIVNGGASSIRVSTKAGELTAEGYSGFYMTDREQDAADYACSYLTHQGEIGVIELHWNPQGMKVLELDNDTPGNIEIFEKFMMENIGCDEGLDFKSGDFDMISGPHAVAGQKGLSNDFWQYAITRPHGIQGLKTVTHKVHQCPH